MWLRISPGSIVNENSIRPFSIELQRFFKWSWKIRVYLETRTINVQWKCNWRRGEGFSRRSKRRRHLPKIRANFFLTNRQTDRQTNKTLWFIGKFPTIFEHCHLVQNFPPVPEMLSKIQSDPFPLGYSDFLL